MNKIILSILLFVFPYTLAFGCDCANFLYTTNDRYIISDFVGIIKINDTVESPDSTEWKRYKAEIKSLATFKGKAPHELYVLGYKDGKNWFSSCDKTVKPKEEYLVAISKNENGKYFISYCSFLRKIKYSERKSVSRTNNWREVKHFQFLAQKVPGLHREYMLNESSGKLFDYLSNFDGQSFDRKSAHYLITFDSNLNVKKVEVLQGFEAEFDKKFVTFLVQQTSWEKDNPSYNKTPVQDGTRHILGIYYHEGEKKFLSRF